MRRWKITLLALGVGLFLLVVGAWMLRWWWFPWLLRGYMYVHDIGRVRYEELIWDKPSHLTFCGFAFRKGAWDFGADKVEIKLWPCRSVYIQNGRLGKGGVQLAVDGAKTPTPASLNFLLDWIETLSALDTLLLDSLELPYGLAVSFVKGGRQWKGSLRRGISEVIGQGEWIGDTLRFRLDSARFIEGGGGYVGWDSIRGYLSKGENKLDIKILGWGWRLFHKRIASRPLFYEVAGMKGEWRIVQDTHCLSIRPYHMPLDFTLTLWWHPKHSWLQAWVFVPEQPHRAFLEAFPEGFFTCLSQAVIEGTSSVSLRMEYNPHSRDTLSLDVGWEAHDFRLLRWNGRNPLSLLEPFEYQPYRSARRIWLGPESNSYLAFSQITPYVLHAVLHSEDGIFFYHSGFQKERFIKALLENWHCRCFRRGAGTITMQVVRNLLLTREKNLARKVEEILLTALIERFRLLSKQRIAELYFNMVEWGPEVYGLTEAAHFYFAKEPHELTIPEAIFLGLLLPSPKAYRHFVDKETGCALASLRPYFQTIARFLVHQNYLHPDSVETIVPERVCLTAPAWRKDSVVFASPMP
ncbi:MAG: transglycosylase domain-containing protein [Bacteroidia bacterium]|nr:transglycosylase domain-containing protein [Bacteroidia bacterium]MDW8133786.1 transglycosylase domain-containing protein [Bacteroidia bacterium]